MICKPNGRKKYIVKFMVGGKPVQVRTATGNSKVAGRIEVKLKNAVAEGVAIADLPKLLRPEPESSSPTLREFLTKDFEPFIKTEHQSVANTLHVYHQALRNLKASDLGSMRFDEITSLHVNGYVAQHGRFAKATINRDLRVLRRALHCGEEWGKLNKSPKVVLVKGETRRERVLTDSEAERYLAACPEPWRDVATIMLGSGACPGELYELRWENVILNGQGGWFHIVKGKTKARRRLLPMVPVVYRTFKSRWESQDCPSTGWVFPTGSRSGHMQEGSAKQWHDAALATLDKAWKENPALPEVKPFPPYTLRHTALTLLSKAGCDAFTLARIAGHSNITTTMRYIHPQAEAIEQAFAKIAGSQKLVTTGGYQGNSHIQSETEAQTINVELSKG